MFHKLFNALARDTACRTPILTNACVYEKNV